MNLRWAIKILGAFALVIALIIIPTAIYLGSTLKTSLIDQKEEDLKRDLNLAIWILADHLQPPQYDLAQVQRVTEQLGRQLGKRVTLISPAGRVIGDSILSRNRLDQAVDLSNRPEILALKTKEYGRMIRFSPELRSNTLFGASPIRKKEAILAYVRIAVPLSQTEKTAASLQQGLLLAGGLMLVLAALISLLLAKKMGRPIREITEMVQSMNQGDFKQPFHLLSQSEFKELAAALETLSASLSGKMDLLETETGELKTLLASMREGVLVTDEKGRIILINPFLTEVLGEKVSWKKRSVQEAFMSAELQDAVEAVLKGDPFQRIQFFFGRDFQRHFEVQVIALTSAHRPPRAVAIFHETTELRYLLNVRQAFVANASWELDRPLTDIKRRLDNLLPMIPNELPEVQQTISSIHGGVKRLCLLVSDMLDLAKLDVQEKVKKNYERVGIKELLKTIVEMVKEQIQGKKLHLELDLENLPEGITAFWEKARVTQALYNVLDNAVKYNRDGGRIRLTADLISAPSTTIRNPQSAIKISVADTGPGIPKEHLPRIFERFYRVDREYSRQLGGTGLGLSIVKHIIESHGGTVEVESQIGKGSTFTLTLPLEPEWRSSKKT
jgi:two-component system, OmpR family, phosphate regulon sensor histidine kinase PhoR